MRKIISALVISIFLCSGCASHKIQYRSFVIPPIAPSSEPVRIVAGNLGDIVRIGERLSLPHVTQSEVVRGQNAQRHEITRQLGNDDYVFIGEMAGTGNAKASLDTLKEAMSKKAAQNGGNVLFIYAEGIMEQPFVYAVPGYSTSTFNANANTYLYSNYAHTSAQGYGSSYYMPPQTYSGTHYFPYVQALVLIYQPGLDNYFARIDRLTPEQLAIFDVKKKQLNLKNLQFASRHAKMKDLLSEVEKSHGRRSPMSRPHVFKKTDSK